MGKLYYPEKPTPSGKCHECAKGLAKETSLFCNRACQHQYYSWPESDQIEEWVLDSVCDATDGCQVEPDGICPHGYKSWLLILGLC